MESRLGQAFSGDCFWEGIFGAIVLLQLWFIFGQRVTVTILRCVLFFCFHPYRCIVSLKTAFCYLCGYVHETTFLSSLLNRDDYLARAAKEQRKIDKAMEDNIWKGLLERESASSCERSWEESQTKNKNSTTAYTGLAEPVGESSKSNGSAKRRKKKK